MHIGGTEEIVIGDVDVLAAGPWLWTDKQPRLIHVVHTIEMVCRLGDARRALKIIEGKSRRVRVKCTIDISAQGEKRARQTLRLSEVDCLITRATRNAGCPRWGVDRKLFR